MKHLHSAVLQQGREKRAVSVSRFSGPIFPIPPKYLPKKREFPMPGLLSGFPCRKLAKAVALFFTGELEMFMTFVAYFKGMPKN